jgi:hypothetical protein
VGEESWGLVLGVIWEGRCAGVSEREGVRGEFLRGSSSLPATMAFAGWRRWAANVAREIWTRK